jgi:Ca2+-transporting ATPase
MKTILVPHALCVEETAQRFETSLDSGLTSDEAKKRLKEYGSNELAKGKRVTWLQRLLAQFSDFLVLILIGASIISIIVGEITDALVIMGIVIANAVLGIVQESKADKALEALEEMGAPTATVIRNGNTEEIPGRELVPGDLVILEAGDYIPADLRLVTCSNLKIEEASLTGESVPAEKEANIELPEDTPIGDRSNRGFMSTIVTYGRAQGIVTATGMNTEIGKIAGKIQSYSQEKTHLQRKLEQLGKYLGLAVLGICVIIFLIGLTRGEPALDMFMTAVSLAVAAVPEGLPAVVTIVLALGMQRMIEHSVIIRRLLAVETLGTTTVICSDKTGTLTQNQMTAVKLYLPGKWINVSGTGYDPNGNFTYEDTPEEYIDPKSIPTLKSLLLAGGLCNDAELIASDDSSPNGTSNGYRIIGDPTEGALVVALEKAGLPKKDMEQILPRVYEFPFDSDRKRMSTIHKNPENDNYVSYTKGGPDVILARCTHVLKDDKVVLLEDDSRNAILAANESMARNALRVLAVAYKEVDHIPKNGEIDAVENGLIFIGLAGLIDPPRIEVIDAINKCKTAGIKVKMITGDHAITALAIAKELGIATEDSKALSGQDLEQMSDHELADIVEDVNVYARVSPEHKVKIVEALKKKGHITAMTGDGVNDALALKRSDIGVAMGITGTDVARETADMILTDDNFASIVAAVEEGRTIYSNIRKFVYFLLSCNIGEVLVIFTAIMLRWEIPLLPIHLLWINLVTDAFPALALGVEKPEMQIMFQPPRHPKEPILDRLMQTGIAVQGIFITIATLGAFWYGWKYLDNLELGRTLAFTTLITAELLRAHSSRSEKYSLASMGFFSNTYMLSATTFSFVLVLLVLYVPALDVIFKTSPLSATHWGIVIGLGLMPSIASEIMKMFIKKPATRA